MNINSIASRLTSVEEVLEKNRLTNNIYKTKIQDITSAFQYCNSEINKLKSFMQLFQIQLEQFCRDQGRLDILATPNLQQEEHLNEQIQPELQHNQYKFTPIIII